jgi:glycosyltransferase involved in cell wall biosynthesis
LLRADTALQAGFAAARNPYLVFADADLTYDFRVGPALIAAMHNLEAAMAVGTRMLGHIEPGAMPALHRLVGTPMRTWIINRLFGGSLSDCNSGFRALRKDSIARWGADLAGMEFASELLTNALEAGSKIVEVPVTLRCTRADRQPHLQTWRDGMRHLLIILARLRRGYSSTSGFFSVCCRVDRNWLSARTADRDGSIRALRLPHAYPGGDHGIFR